MGVTLAIFIVEYEHWRKNIKIALTVIIAGILGAYTGIAVACGIQ